MASADLEDTESVQEAVHQAAGHGWGVLMMTGGRMALATGAIGLGAIGLAVGDFAMQWQPVPETLPGRMALAYVTAGLFAALGIGLLIKRSERFSAAVMIVAFLLWAVLLHGPKVAAAPLNILPWLGFSEVLAVAAGALALVAAHVPGTLFSYWGGLIARYGFGLCLPVFGLSHLAHVEFTAGMVPAWMPFPVFWAVFTGAGHIAAGIAILTGVAARLGAVLFAVMVSGFVLLLHVPGAIGDPTSRKEWTMLAIATLITSAAWIIAGNLLSMRRVAARRQA